MFVPEEVGDMSLALFRFIKLPHHMYLLIFHYSSHSATFTWARHSAATSVSTTTAPRCAPASASGERQQFSNGKLELNGKYFITN